MEGKGIGWKKNRQERKYLGVPPPSIHPSLSPFLGLSHLNSNFPSLPTLRPRLNEAFKGAVVFLKPKARTGVCQWSRTFQSGMDIVNVDKEFYHPNQYCCLEVREEIRQGMKG